MFYMRNFLTVYASDGEPGSSESVVSGYGLGNRAMEVRAPQRQKDFFL
jgi:hypothetical protein